jgi:hypothetical protein
MPVPFKPNWRIIVIDQQIQIKFTGFFKTKDEMVEPTCEQLHQWQQSNKGITHLRMDNAGKNKKLKERCVSKDWKLKLEFEFTARDTPQQNSLAEVGFATLANRGRALMHRANLSMAMRYKLAQEAFTCATMLDGLIPVTVDGITKTRYEHFNGENPAFAQHLRTWGEAGTVKIKSKTSPKLYDKGIHCMFVGYTSDHPGDCYRMFDPKTNGIRVTRDVIWLKRMFFNKPSNNRELITDEVMFEVTRDGSVIALDEQEENEQDQEQEQNEPNDNDNPTEILEDESEEDGEGGTDSNDSEMETTPPATTKTSSGRQINQPKWMGDYELGMSAAEITYYKAMKVLSEDLGVEMGLIGAEMDCSEACLIGAGLGDGISNTNELKILSFDEAMKQPDRLEWEKSVAEEHSRMKENAVFQAIQREKVPHNADIIDSTWSMKKRANGVYRARLAGRGFKQRPGVSYDPKNIFAPVAHKITIKVALVLMLMAGWTATVVDVKGAFLKAPFDPRHRVYMEVPKGFKQFYPKNCVLLGKECSKSILVSSPKTYGLFWIQAK